MKPLRRTFLLLSMLAALFLPLRASARSDCFFTESCEITAQSLPLEGKVARESRMRCPASESAVPEHIKNASFLSAAANPTPLRDEPLDYIRLHILAQSDSLHDQAVKLCVRNDIREYTGELLKNCENPDDAWSVLLTHENELLRIARESAARYGFSGSVSLDLGVFSFPDRTYGGELVPAGDYRAVRITLGDGEGRNWWCVVYPSLCLPEAADIDKPVEFYSSIFRWAVRMWEAIKK